MGFMNPLGGMKRNYTGYYPDYAEPSSSPYYGSQQGQSAASTVTSQGGHPRVSFNPFAYDSPVGAGQQYTPDQGAANTTQEGHDQAKQAQLAAEIGYAQDATKQASTEQRGSSAPGGPDVQLTTRGDSGDAIEEVGGGSTRRRRGAYQGSGLKI